MQTSSHVLMKKIIHIRKENTMKQVCVVLNDETQAKVAELAKKDEISVSAVIRQLVKIGLEKICSDACCVPPTT